MGNYLLAAGLLLNSALIVISRFVKHLPEWLYMGGMILGIGLIIAAAVMMKSGN